MLSLFACLRPLLITPPTYNCRTIRGNTRCLSDAKLLELQRLATASIGVNDLVRQRGLILEQSQAIKELRLLQEHIEQLDGEIKAIVENAQEGQILISMGIGPIQAATIIAVIGSIENFPNIRLTCTSECACCPPCRTISQRIHGKYGRTLADLPCGGRHVILALTIRKFVCGTTTCSCRIFTERLSKLTQPYAHMTNRLRAALQALGLATSGEASARVSEQLGMPVPASRLIRSLRRITIPPPLAVRIVGIDDWCWKKGQTYGTILVDLERRKPIEVLPDRKAETVEVWLLTHPEIESGQPRSRRGICCCRPQRRPSSATSRRQGSSVAQSA